MINGQLSKQGIHWPVPPDLVAGSGNEVKYFLRLPADKFLVCKWSQAQVQFYLTHRKQVVLMSCTNEILISIWHQTWKFCQFLQVGKAVTLDSPRWSVGHPLCPLFMLWLVKIWQLSSFGKFRQHLETCLLRAEVDRVLCHLVMFLLSFSTGCTKWNTTAFKIVLLFMSGLFTGFFVKKCAACQSHWKSDFRWNCAHLAWCVRGLKSWPYFMAFRSCSILTDRP